jgi:hypothetical protein
VGKIRRFLAAVAEENLGGKPADGEARRAAVRAAWAQAALVLLNSNEFLYVGSVTRRPRA